jgi:alkanesulfonate monooxygenase SsuD/methylene tetrahydromethanopterin reductase-like flavin-dependent oxidoreductase (luciferase family)
MTTLDLNPTAPRPAEETQPLVDRTLTNPMFNDQKMKLGLFGTNCSYGLTMSHAPSTYEATWDHTLEIARRAESLGFEALVPIARWRGFGGTTNFNGNCFETYTWAAGLLQATDKIAIFSTSHLPTVHPIVAAKAAVTNDHISKGRFGLNLVMGWFSPEMDMFHGSQLEHDERYAFGQEWLDLVQRLWSEPGSFDFHGKFFQGEGLEAYPKPYQAPQPVLINAGNSPSGVDFSARNVDINFASLDTLETIADYTKNIRRKAREDYGRDISTMTYGLVVARDTEKEAKDAFQAIIDHGDWGAAGNVMKVAGMESQSFNEQIKKFQERFIAGWAGYPVVGTPEQVVEELGRLNTAGMDGMIMGFLDYNEEMKYFGVHVLPLTKQAGLRHD